MKLKALTFSLFAAGLLAGLTLIAPATGADGPATTTTAATVYMSGSGTIDALSATSITVGSLTCSRGSGSPSLDGYKLKDAVGIGCANGVLSVVADKRTAATTTTTTNASETNAQDPISALSATSITVGPLTCSIGSGSPTFSFKIGDRVRIGCVDGKLNSIAAGTPLPTPTTTAAPVVTKGGTLTAIGSNTITVDGTVCAVYPPTSPSITPFKIGDRVGIACQSSVLIKIAPLTDGTASTTTTANGDSSTVTKSGTISEIGTTGIRIGDFSCKLVSTSPSVASFKAGDLVGIGCQGGALIKIALLAPASSGEDHQELQTRLGSITALGATSITVDGLTCSIGSSSPSVSAFAVGDRVGIGCANNVLVKIGNAPYGGDDGGFKVVVAIGAIARLSSDLIRVGTVACELATTSPSVASFSVGDRVGIGCAGGILFMIGAVPAPGDTPTSTVKGALVQRFNTCIKNGAERCTVASVLKRLAKHAKK